MQESSYQRLRKAYDAAAALNGDLVDALVKSMRAAGKPDDEVVLALAELISEPETLGDAILKSLGNPTDVGVGDGLPVGAGTFNPVSPETSARLKKERAEREAAEAEALAKTRADLRTRPRPSSCTSAAAGWPRSRSGGWWSPRSQRSRPRQCPLGGRRARGVVASSSPSDERAGGRCLSSTAGAPSLSEYAESDAT
jgi:hypothetical protein